MTVVTDASGLDLGAYLRRGDRIVWGQACGEPTTLVEALIAQADVIGGLSAFAATSFSGLLSAEAAAKFNLSSMGAIGALRTVAAAGRLGIVPCHVSQVGPMIEQGLIGCDVAFVQVSPSRRGRQSQLWADRRFRSGRRREGARGHRRGQRARALYAGRCGVAGGAHRLRSPRLAASSRGSCGPNRRGRSIHRPDRGRLYRGRRGDSGRRRRGARRDPPIARGST